MPQLEHAYRCRGGAAGLMRCNSPEVLFEGPAGTGKTRGVLEKINLLCELYPRCRVLICRATRTSCTESILVTLERDVLRPDLPGMLRTISRGQRDTYEYENGSVIVVGGLDHPERLFSTEWDIVYVAESIEITEDAWEKFARAMRNKAIPLQLDGKGPLDADTKPVPGVTQAVDAAGKPRWWTQRIADCNPGAPGHWINQRAVRGGMTRLRSKHEDNPSCSEDFLDGLRALTGHRRARLYEGRWVAAEGAVFPEFNEDLHKCEPFEIPGDWPVLLAKDPGRNHRDVTLAMAVTPLYVDLHDRQGNPYRIYKLIVVQEHVTGNESPSGIPSSTEQDAATIRTDFDPKYRIVKKLGDPHMMFNATKFAEKGESIADQLRGYGQHFSPGKAANNAAEIAAQCELVRTYLKTIGPDGRPMLEIFDTCPCTIGSFQTWAYKKNAQGEATGAFDQFGEEGKDEMDCVRQIVAEKPSFDGMAKAEAYASSE